MASLFLHSNCFLGAFFSPFFSYSLMLVNIFFNQAVSALRIIKPILLCISLLPPVKSLWLTCGLARSNGLATSKGLILMLYKLSQNTRLPVKCLGVLWNAGVSYTAGNAYLTKCFFKTTFSLSLMILRMIHQEKISSALPST